MRIYGFDIETDNSEGHGLDSRFSRVTSIAISATDSLFVLDDTNEARLLRTFAAWLTDNETLPGIIATWNGSGFDVPFLADRAEATGVEIPLIAWADETVVPKYPSPNPNHATGYRAKFGVHNHVDICYAYKPYAEQNDVKWSLKPVADALGLDLFVEDAADLHNVHPVNRLAYNGSDAHATRLLAEQLKSLPDHVDKQL